MSVGLVAMRLIDMTRVHPAQDNTRVCSQCGERVGIYPSGQQVLKERPDTKIICHMCASKGGQPVWPAASWAEIAQESRDSVDTPKA